jgi:hypothetical protein
LIALSRERFGRKREEVEAEMLRAHPTSSPAPEKENACREPKPIPRAAPAKESKLPAVTQEVPDVEQAPVRAGRGGGQHKYLQQLIKRWAESKGYRVTIEKQILDGLGSIDVALENEKRKIACEISVSSTAEQELGNIQKCLAAGFVHVVLVSTEKKALVNARKLVMGTLGEDKVKQVQFLTPEELFIYIESLEAEAAERQDTVRGYRVKVQYRGLGEEEKKSRKQAISEVILKALKRLKGSKPEKSDPS